jgi:uncharacterized repeat protein (TIGR02543 family)
MASGTHTYDQAANLTVNGFTRTSYTFAGWNTAQNGGGTSYVDGESVRNLASTQNATVTLYAKWTADSYNISYVLNGGPNAANPVTYTIESSINLIAPTRPNYAFMGWYDNPGLTGTAVTGIPLGSTGDKTFYAKWLIAYSIIYHLNGGTNNPANPDWYTEEDNVILAWPTRPGYSFTGWHDIPSLLNLVTEIPRGSAGHWIFYAAWGPNVYYVEYDANGGSGNTSSSTHTYDQFQNLTKNGFSKSGYTFGRWNTQPDGSGTSYTDEQWVENLSSTLEATITLYAQWWSHIDVNITLWVDEGGSGILVSGDDVTISRSGAGNPDYFTATVTSTYTGIQWHLDGFPINGSRGAAQSITIKAADYDPGAYILGVTVTRDGIPYSTDLRFTVEN